MGVVGGIVEYAMPGDVLTYTVGATAVTGGQLVELDASGNVVHAGDESLKCVGVAMHDAAIGAKVSVARVGVWPLKAAGAVAIGDQLAPAAAGDVKAQAAAAGATAEDINDARAIVGLALAAISSGQRGKCMLRML